VVLIFRRFHVANSKYVETPYGTKLIKEFFWSDEKWSGEDVSDWNQKISEHY
jgi:hypothetical protein